MKILLGDNIVNVREPIKDLELATKMQTPILKYFHIKERDVVSGHNLGEVK